MLFDAHADILTDMYEQNKKGNRNSFKRRHLDYYKKAGITHSIFVNWTNPKTENTQEFNEIWENAFIELQNNKDVFNICLNYEDIINSTTTDRIGVIIGMEGIMQLESVNHLTELYDKGVRHAGLTWNEVNKYAAGLSSETEGLTLLGKEVLIEMEKLGMIIDLAHANPRTFKEIFEVTTQPLIISHGNTKQLCNHIRNYTDEQLNMIKERNGVIGICGIAPFISDKKENQTVAYMAKHIDYAVKTIGIDHVGIGFDVCYYLYDNVSSNHVEGFMNMGEANNLFTELEKLGYNLEDIEKIKYKNFFRVFKEIL
ncbi:Membrane dipeptidase (Peptidase family M19) [Candidatus Izimaplasma bacterium HR1]|jgi:membrane dipeptidase|uniref:dipeptidase n=1 Tax=Candidatus Izimoplasma sp. HR1 TaxID=1541959 RepID=UPI0004F85A8A|nr:Membrane dipeptidase (Peptidase family M19) [Candidatus Izimaplasma bacterium HR1]